MNPVKIGYPLIHLPSVDSTNVYAITLLQTTSVTEGTVILADHQMKGKGQGGSLWQSDSNTNLLFSVILKPDFLRADKQYYLSMCISAGIADFVGSVAGNALIKWPNDILAGEKKIAGILIENSIMGENLYTSVVGIGLNVNQVNFPDDIPDPVSLRMITGETYELPALFNRLLESLTRAIELLYTGRLDIIKNTYLNKLWRLNQWHWFSDAGGKFEGRITDVAESGELIVMRKNNELKYYGFKEIQLSTPQI